MKFLKLFFIIATIALFALACNNASNTADKTSNAAPPTTKQNVNTNNAAANANQASTDELAHAREIYGERCAKCHGANADGGLVEFDNVKLKVPGLREGHARSHTDQQLARRISNGGEGMPAFKEKLSAEEIDSLVRLIRHDFQGQSASTTTTTASAPVATENK